MLGTVNMSSVELCPLYNCSDLNKCLPILQPRQLIRSIQCFGCLIRILIVAYNETEATAAISMPREQLPLSVTPP